MSFKSICAAGKIQLSLFLFSIMLSATTATAQNYWNQIPAFTSQCYSETDPFGEQVRQLRVEVRKRMDESKKEVEEIANKMTDEQRMAVATKYQNMKPDEIVKFQNETMAFAKLQTEFQQLSSDFETQFNDIEAEFRLEFRRRLGPIETEYNNLPDGEGTPDWAIKKGEELRKRYNQEYEQICSKYFTSADARFQVWLKEFSLFLHEHEVPFNQMTIKSQYRPFGITPDESVASLMALDKYLEKCELIFGMRRQYKNG